MDGVVGGGGGPCVVGVGGSGLAEGLIGSGVFAASPVGVAVVDFFTDFFAGFDFVVVFVVVVVDVDCATVANGIAKAAARPATANLLRK